MQGPWRSPRLRRNDRIFRFAPLPFLSSNRTLENDCRACHSEEPEATRNLAVLHCRARFFASLSNDKPESFQAAFWLVTCHLSLVTASMSKRTLAELLLVVVTF